MIDRRSAILTAALCVAAGCCVWLPLHGLWAAADPPAAFGKIEGTVAYDADPRQPWRYQRYYVQDAKQGWLAEAVVSLDERKLNERGERKAAVHDMDQKDFRFVPETIAIRAGDTVKFTNSDAVVHNVSGYDLTSFNVNTPPDGSYAQEFPRGGGIARPVRIGCVYHSSMQAWIYVFEHPFFGVTPDNGRFRFANVPPGRYRLGIVHPAGDLRTSQFVEVRAGETTSIDIRLSPENLIRRN